MVTLLAVDWNSPVDSGDTANSFGQSHYEYFLKHILDWLEYLGDNYEIQFHNVFEYLRRVRNLKKVVTDSNGCGRPIYDRLTATLSEFDIQVDDFNFQPKLKSDCFKSLYADVCGGRLTFPASDPVRSTLPYRKFINQMLDARKTYKNQLMQVAHPDEKDAHDDYCVLSISHVMTERGEIPIEEVTTNDKVWTRKGWRKVLASNQTGVKEVIRVGNLVATPNHPFFCVNRNSFIPLAELDLDDTIMSCVSIQKDDKLDFLMESSTIGILSEVVPLLNTSIVEKVKRCILQCGNSIEAQSLKVKSFIIRMMTELITKYPIWSWLLGDSMFGYTCGIPKDLRFTEKQSSWLNKLRCDLHTGNLLREEQTKEIKLKELGIIGSIVPWFVKSAVKNLKLEHGKTPILVPVSVRHAVGDALTIKKFESLIPGEKVPVYNLQIDEVNEFVCQGALVHNCDSVALAAWGANSPSGSSVIDYLDSNIFMAR